ncbi:MAG: alpha/beta fold hydrolase [Solirubrobacterales bacterium]
MKFDLSKANYKIEGSGLPLYLIGGQFMTLKGWEPTLEDLKRFYKVIVLEYPNQGESEVNLDFNNLKLYAEYSKDFLEAVGVNPEETVVFGLSFGANIAKSLTFDFGVRFKAAILAGVSSYKLKDYIIENYKLWIDLIHSDQLQLLSRVINLKLLSPAFVVKSPGYLEFAAKQMSESYENRKDSLVCLLQSTINYLSEVEIDSDKRFPFDVHLIGAKSDPMMPINYVREYAEQLNAPLYELEGGHIMTMEYSFDLISIIHDILADYDN